MSGESRTTVGVVIPAQDEEGAIGPLIAEVQLAAGAAETYSLIAIRVVDNGSHDATALRAAEAGAEVVTEPRRGYGQACIAGVNASADADVLVFMDGDGSEVPGEIEFVLSPLLNGDADLVLGSRVLGQAEDGALLPQQRAGNWIAARLLRLLFDVDVSDLGPYRAIRRADLLNLGMTEMTYGWPTEMIARAARAGLIVREVPVSCRRRRSGQSKVSGSLRASARTGWRIAVTLARVRRADVPELRPTRV